jgi:hypothetical protein
MFIFLKSTQKDRYFDLFWERKHFLTPFYAKPNLISAGFVRQKRRKKDSIYVPSLFNKIWQSLPPFLSITNPAPAYKASSTGLVDFLLENFVFVLSRPTAPTRHIPAQYWYIKKSYKKSWRWLICIQGPLAIPVFIPSLHTWFIIKKPWRGSRVKGGVGSNNMQIFRCCVFCQRFLSPCIYIGSPLFGTTFNAVVMLANIKKF